MQLSECKPNTKVQYWHNNSIGSLDIRHSMNVNLIAATVLRAAKVKVLITDEYGRTGWMYPSHLSLRDWEP